MLLYRLTKQYLCASLQIGRTFYEPTTTKMKIRESEKRWIAIMVVALLAAGVIVVTGLILRNLMRNKDIEVRSYSPDIRTSHKKKVWDAEWERFEYIVSQCREIIETDAFLQERKAFWEDRGIEPAVGYTAWLFQESRLDGDEPGDNGRAHGYGQIHVRALSEINSIRTDRGSRTFSHEEIRGKSPERLRFFLEALHDYTDLCGRRYDRKRGLDADLNAWNGGCTGGSKRETVYSGQIKSVILQYYERKKAEEAKQKRADAKRRP